MCFSAFVLEMSVMMKSREKINAVGSRLIHRLLLLLIILLPCQNDVRAQQTPDPQYTPVVSRPAYEAGKGPRVAIDETHHNFHTLEGRYKPFAELLRRDGYRVGAFREPFTSDALMTVEVLVVANPLHKRNIKDWSLPVPSAFTREEIVAVRKWVETGGALFLIADHMPFPGAVDELANAFGVAFSNGYAIPGHRVAGEWDVFDHETGLIESAITLGRTDDPKVTAIATFVGSAFKAPKDAIPILVFGAGAVSLEVEKAGEFTSETPRIPIDGWCQGAVMASGDGRVAVFGEAAMFTAQRAGADKTPVGMNAPAARQNHQLLLNVMHWLTRVHY